MKSWSRQRKYALLLAEDAGTRRLLGVVMCCLLAAEALLPPPFPSTAPLRSAGCILVAVPCHSSRRLPADLTPLWSSFSAQWHACTACRRCASAFPGCTPCMNVPTSGIVSAYVMFVAITSVT